LKGEGKWEQGKNNRHPTLGGCPRNSNDVRRSRSAQSNQQYREQPDNEKASRDPTESLTPYVVNAGCHATDPEQTDYDSSQIAVSSEQFFDEQNWPDDEQQRSDEGADGKLDAIEPTKYLAQPLHYFRDCPLSMMPLIRLPAARDSA
jgi:hypothetical protein